MQYNKINTRSMLEGSLMAVILVIAMFLEIYAPVIGIIFMFALPLPITIVYVKDGLKYAIGSLVVAGVIGMILISPVLAVPLIADAGLVGITLGFCITHNKSAIKSYLYMTIAFFFVSAVTIGTASLFTDVKGIPGLIDEAVTAYNQSIDSAKQLYLSMGVNKQQIEQVFSQTNGITRDTLLTIFPAVMIFSSMIFSYLNYKLTASIFRRIKIKMNELRSFEYIYIPNLLAAAMIALTCIGLILQAKKVGIGSYIFASTYSMFQLALLIQGIAVALYFFKNRLSNSKAAVVIIILTALILKDIYVYVGIAELIFDFRKIDPTRARNIR